MIYPEPQAAAAAARVREQAMAAKAAQQRQRLAVFKTFLMKGETGLHLPRPHPGKGVMAGCLAMTDTLVEMPPLAEMAALAEGLDQKAQPVKTERL